MLRRIAPAAAAALWVLAVCEILGFPGTITWSVSGAVAAVLAVVVWIGPDRARFAPVAALAALVLALPLAGLRGDEGAGFVTNLRPVLACSMIACCAGAVFALAATLEARHAATPHRGPVVPLPAVALRAAPWALAGVVAALPLLGLPGAWTKLLVDTMVFATIAVGLQITIGMAGLLVLGHAAFWAVGAYTFGLLTIHGGWNFWPAFAASGAAAALAGLVIGLPALRLRGDYLAVVTLGFGEAVRWIIKNEQDVTGGDASLPSNIVRGTFRKPQGLLGDWLWQPPAVHGMPGSMEVQQKIDREAYWFSLALLVVCVVCVTLLARSRIGRALYALREDETAAKCMGIDTTRTKLLAFMSSALWAGLAGVIPAVHRGSINPEMFDFNTSVLFVAMVVLGGLGSVAGAIVGAALLWMLPALLGNWLPDVQQYRYLFFGALMAAMMVVRPEGLLGGAPRRKAAQP